MNLIEGCLIQVLMLYQSILLVLYFQAHRLLCACWISLRQVLLSSSIKINYIEYRKKHIHMKIDVIWNSVIVGFSQLIPGYKQTYTVKASWCTTKHNKVIYQFVQYHDILTVKIYLYLGISWEHPKLSQFRSISILTVYTFQKKKNLKYLKIGITH